MGKINALSYPYATYKDNYRIHSQQYNSEHNIRKHFNLVASVVYALVVQRPLWKIGLSFNMGKIGGKKWELPGKLPFLPSCIKKAPKAPFLCI